MNALLNILLHPPPVRHAENCRELFGQASNCLRAKHESGGDAIEKISHEAFEKRRRDE